MDPLSGEVYPKSAYEPAKPAPKDTTRRDEEGEEEEEEKDEDEPEVNRQQEVVLTCSTHVICTYTHAYVSWLTTLQYVMELLICK